MPVQKDQENSNQPTRAFKGVWFPADIWLMEDLSLIDKGLLIEIDSLDCSDRHCFATNSYFAKFFQCDSRTIQRSIKKLIDKKLIESIGNTQNRQLISLLSKFTHDKMSQDSRQNVASYSRQNVAHNNISINNINNKETKAKKAKLSLSPHLKEEAKEILESLNENINNLVSIDNGKTFRGYRNTESNINIIASRLADGFSKEDLKIMCYQKTVEWGKDSKMISYIRPSTLFRKSNCENYISQLPKEKSINNKETILRYKEYDCITDTYSVKETIL